MPFKTRKQKEAAAGRRYLESDSVSINYSLADSVVGKVDTQRQRSDESQSVEKLTYVRTDLVKILVIASLIITAQIILALTRA